MSSGILRSVVALVILLSFLVAIRAQARRRDHGGADDPRRPATRHDGFTPEKLRLKKGNERTSEAFVDRVYTKQGKVTTLKSDYTLKPGEKVRRHMGVDVSTRYEGEKQSKPMDFAAGVYGTVLKAGDGQWGTITVRLEDGSIVQYLHTSLAHVKVGDTVTPDTVIGASGSTGASAVHIHIQAKDKDGKPIHPDEAFRRGQRRPLTPIPYIRLNFVDFDPDTSSVGEPKVEGGIVRFGYDENAEKRLGGTNWREVGDENSRVPGEDWQWNFGEDGKVYYFNANKAFPPSLKINSTRMKWEQSVKKVTCIWTHSVFAGEDGTVAFEGSVDGDTIRGVWKKYGFGFGKRADKSVSWKRVK